MKYEGLKKTVENTNKTKRTIQKRNRENPSRYQSSWKKTNKKTNIIKNSATKNHTPYMGGAWRREDGKLCLCGGGWVGGLGGDLGGHDQYGWNHCWGKGGRDPNFLL